MKALNTNISSIEIHQDWKYITVSAVLGCKNLSGQINLENIKSIGASAFLNCPKITSVKLSNSLKEIGYQVFGSCTNLQSVTIQDGVTSIGEKAFNRCSNLTAVNYTGTEEQWNAITIGEYNDDLNNATKTYNYDPNAQV